MGVRVLLEELDMLAWKACEKSVGGAIGALICGIGYSVVEGRKPGVLGSEKSTGAVSGADGKLVV